jgi:hypothetical protein
MRSPKAAGWGILGLCFALAGCATPSVRVEAQGGGPDFKTAPTFALDLGAADAAARTDPTLAAAVVDRLRSHGMVEDHGEEARILVEVAFTDRPLRVGDFVGAQPAAGVRQWLTTPERPGLWTSPHARVCSLAVRMSVPATGVELYRVRAAVRPPRQGCGEVMGRLADAALARIPLPPQR